MRSVTLLPDTLAICRLEPDAAVPDWGASGSFYSITRTPDEVSIVCEQSAVPADVRSEREWRCFKLAGPIPFTTVGVLAALVAPLADAGISVFAVSTFDTDYLLVKEADFSEAVAALRAAGHLVEQLNS